MSVFMQRKTNVRWAGIKAGLLGLGMGLAAITLSAATPVLDFEFDEGQGPNTTDSVNQLVGTLSSTNTTAPTLPTFVTDTPSGLTNDTALHFEPGQQVMVADPDTKLQFDTNNPSFTLQAWIKFQTNPTNRQVFFYNNGPGGAVSFSVFTNRTLFVTTLGVKDQTSLAAVPNDGAWHHVAVVHENKKEFRFYVDGLLADTQAYTGGVIFTRTNRVFYLGSESTGGLQFVGSLDRMKVSSGMLTPDELDFRTGAPGPMVDFQFNEGKGTTTTDKANLLLGTFGIMTNPANDPVGVTNSPSGAANDRSVSFNTGTTNQAGLVVDDTQAPILAFATNAPFTMEAWVNREAGDTRQYEGIGAYGRSYKMGFNNGEFIFTLFGIVDIMSGITPPEGEWHHLATVWQPGTGAGFYLDGVLVTNVAETRVRRAYQNNILTIGAENVSSNGVVVAFQGMIDRFRIHQGALTATELDSAAATPKAVLTNTLVAYQFNQTAAPFTNSAAANRPALASNKYLQQTTSPAWITDTPSGKAGDFALSFSTNRQVIVSDPNTYLKLDTNNPSFTMQAWVKFAGRPATRQVFFFSNGPGGALSFSVFTNRTLFVTTLGVKDQSSLAAIPDDGNWHHIAVVHENAKEFRFYVDGKLADTQAYTGGVNFTRTNQVSYLGSEPTGGLQYLGSLDRLKVSNGILDPSQFDYPSGAAAPKVLYAGAFDNGVGIAFDKPVDLATATNKANYTVTGATVTGVTVFAGKYVALAVSATPKAGFTVTVKNVKDATGNPITSAAVSGQLSDLISADIGTPGVDPLQPGYAAALGDNGYLVAGGGHDIYDAADGFHYVYTEFSGEFDVRARVEWMNPMQGGANDTWGKAGIMVRETLTGPSRNVHVHVTRADGQNHIETTWRDTTGGSTGGTSIRPAPVPYPNGWIRLVRTDATKNEFTSYTSTNGVNWDLGVTHLIPGSVIPGKVYLGMSVTSHDNSGTIPLCLAVFKQFSISGYPAQPMRNYSLGLKFGADAATTAPTAMQPGDIAGVPGFAQPNWNNIKGANGTNVINIVGDTADDRATNTGVSVTFTSNGTWSSTGQGEENNRFTGADRTLMTGYLDTGNATTTTITISNLPPQLTSNGYDLYVYAMGGVAAGRSGGYRVLDADTKTVLKDYVFATSSSNASYYLEVPVSTNKAAPGVGNYLVFNGLKATNITLEATTANGLGGSGTPRAAVNAIQFVAPPTSAPLPIGPIELGQTVNGFQDDFSGPVRDPNWLPVGPGGDRYQQMNGVLVVTTAAGDPNHLLYVGPGGSNTTQEVLARVRIISFGSGDGPRGGVAVCVSTNVTGQLNNWIGMNLNIRNQLENFGGITNTQHFKLLDDLRGWGPQTSYGWTSNTWYWMRLKMDPAKPDGTNIVYAKTWLADQATPEPAGWDLKWSNPPTPLHGGFAGITGTSANGLAHFEVSYILIKSAGLPSIKVNFNANPAAQAAYVRSVTPAIDATFAEPNTQVQAIIVDGQYPIDPSTVTLRLNNTLVIANTVKVGDVTTITYTPATLFAANSTIQATLGYIEDGQSVSGQWQFSVAPYTLDKLHQYVGALRGPSFFTPSGGGITETPGDYAIDFGRSGAGTSVHVADGSFLKPAASNDVLSISLWVKKYDIANSSAFWINSPSSTGDTRGYQAHIPWSDDSIYFDTAGCCDAKLQRLSASIKNFEAYKAAGTNDGYWTNWHHFVFIKDTTNKSVYIDGKLFLKGTNTAPLPLDFTDLWLGSGGTGVANNMHGLIDDFAVFGSAVSEANIALLADGKLPTSLTGEQLLAYWDFEDAAASSLRSYSIGLNFGADATTNSTLKATSVAGVPAVAQANWNNINGANGTNVANLVIDASDDTAAPTPVTVTFTSNGTWASTGVGEENNQFTGTDRILMTGYLDTGDATTTSVTISNIPPLLATNGYAVYVYAMGGVAGGRSGGYRILDATTKAVLKDYVFATSTSNVLYYVQAPLSTDKTKPGIGNYLVFSGLNASNIILEATTANGLGGGTPPRAPINAIQLVAPPGIGQAPVEPTLSLARSTDGKIIITFTGTLQAADDVLGTWTDVPGNSPMTILPTEDMKFYRAKQ